MRRKGDGIRVGITGHRGLDRQVETRVRALLAGAAGRYVPGELVAVSCLADGPDAWWAETVLERGGRIEAVIPAAQYRDGLPDWHHPTHDRLLGLACDVHETGLTVSDPHAHMAGSEILVGLVDELLAMWDGHPARAYGGTADVVAYAQRQGTTVRVLWPQDASRCPPLTHVLLCRWGGACLPSQPWPWAVALPMPSGLGQPAGEAWSHGRAALRDLQHARAGQPGWVLCLVAGRPPVAVAAPVWQAIVDAGRADAGQDPLAAVGFPVPSAGEGGPWVLKADAQDVDLDGGSWGAGRLTRSAREGWRWQPLPRFSLHQGRSAKNWTAGQTPQLRLRALVNLPWADPGALETTKPRRQQLKQQLPSSALAGALTLLSGRRGAQLSAAHWERGPFGNTARSVGYTCTVIAPDGSPALKAAAMLALPTTLESTVVVCAEVVVEDAAAWAAALGPGWTTRLELEKSRKSC